MAGRELGRRSDERTALPVELIGVDGEPATAQAEANQQVVARTPRTFPTVVAAGVLAALALVLASRPPTTEDAVSPPVTLPTQRANGNDSPADTERSEPPPVTVPATQTEPVAAEAEGIVLVAGRGLEKVFVDLGTGERMVVDVEGEPVASVEGFVALASDGEQLSSDLCWFDIALRRCQFVAPTVDQLSARAFLGEARNPEAFPGETAPRIDGLDVNELGLVHQLDLDATRALRAQSPDARWSAEWVGGQIVVTDERTDDEYKVPGVTRTYFEDGLVLVHG